MRARFFLVMGAITGCGIISGLDGLGVDDDASTDATANDGASDANRDVAPSDASNDTTPPINGSVLCGDKTCASGQHCCDGKSGNTVMCSSTDCPSGDLRYNCDDHTDCPASSACCLANNVATCAPTCDGSVLCILDASPSGCGSGGGGVCKQYLGGLPTTGVCN